jgi:glucose/arabinose dehydrogenase
MPRARRRSMRITLAVLTLLLLRSRTSDAAVSLPNGFVNDVVVGGLDTPNSMAFLPDGRVLFTEQKTGRVRLVVGSILAPQPIVTVPDLNAAGYEQGLQGIAVDPNWPTRPYVYVYHNRTGNRLRLTRYTAGGELTRSSALVITLSNPYIVLDDVPDNDPNHNSGCLRFGPDGALYLSIGEDEDFCAAQDPTKLKGEILRLIVDKLPPGAGGPAPRDLITPTDNPLQTANANAKLVWAYGLRNPWRYSIDKTTGFVYTCDVGESDFEEIDEVHAGDDLGWPWREGNLVMPRSECPEPGGSGTRSFKAPLVSMSRGANLTAIVAAGIYRWPAAGTANWPGPYHGQLFYGEYYSGFLRRLTKSGGAWGPSAAAPGQPNGTDWATGLTAPVDFGVGPDGSLWWLSQYNGSYGGSSGSLNRIRFSGQPVDVPFESSVESALSGAPNPFRVSTDVWFRLANRAVVSLTVLDLAGRHVRTLYRGTAQPGDTRVVWDGRDDAGREVAAGAYMARLEREAQVQTTRLLRLR